MGTTTGEVKHGGSERSFRVHVPKTLDRSEPAPLVLLFHGGGGSGRQLQRRSSHMDRVADRERFITVYPDGTGVVNTWNAGGCCGGSVRNDVDDVGFVAALLDHLEEELCVDRRRVFATGMSNGAMLTHRLACELSDRIAGVAPVAGTNMTATCSPKRPVPVLQIHGSKDAHVRWDGGMGCGLAGVPFTSVPDTVDGWRARNHCSETTKPWLKEGDGTCEIFPGCAEGATVGLCTVEGGGHFWPGGERREPAVDCPGEGGQSETFVADEVIWRFFSALSSK